MKLIVGDRQTGKTRTLLQWAREAPDDEVRIVVAVSRDESMRLLREERETAEREGRPALASWQFVSFSEVTKGGVNMWSALGGRRQQIVLGIDEVSLALQALLRWRIGAMTDRIPEEVVALAPDRT